MGTSNKGFLDQQSGAVDSDVEVIEEEAPTIRVCKRGGKGADRPRLRDEKGDRKKILSRALGLYKVLLMSKNPMPTDMADDDFADDAWFDVCEAVNINIDITDDNRRTVSGTLFNDVNLMYSTDTIPWLSD